jgi:hypothetical protein
MLRAPNTLAHFDQIVKYCFPVYHILTKLSNTVYSYAHIWHIKTYNNIPNLGHNI